MNFTFKALIPDDQIPVTYPTHLLPDFGNPVVTSIPVDIKPPKPVLNLSLSRNVSEQYDVLEIRWEGELGSTGDHLESGSRRYLLSVDDNEYIHPRQTGGLTGTYFGDIEFKQEAKLVENDTPLQDWGVWGPTINGNPLVEDYSVRWDGWIEAPFEEPTPLLVSGSGEIMIISDDEIFLDWTTLGPPVETAYLDPGNAGISEISIFYRNLEGHGRVEIGYLDPLGNSHLLDEELLYHPASHYEIPLGDDGAVDISVITEDWTMSHSTETAGGYVTDRTPPVITPLDYTGWVPEFPTMLEFKLEDRGRGLDPESISYRVHREGTSYDGWSRENLSIESLSGPDEAPREVEVSFPIDPEPYFNGTIEWMARDLAYNLMRVQDIPIACDPVPPEVSMIKPVITSITGTSNITVTLDIEDPYGSGTDLASLRWSSRLVGGKWSDWLPLDTNRSGEGFLSDLPLGYGVFQVRFRIEDRVGNRGESPFYRIELKEPVRNDPPVAIISSPTDGSAFIQGNMVTLDGSRSYDDGYGDFERLRFSWYSNKSGYLGGGRKLTVSPGLGYHRIFLHVDDGTEGHNVSSFVDIQVKKAETQGGDGDGGEIEPETSSEPIWVIMVIMLVLVISIAVLVITFIRGKAKDERLVRLDIAGEENGK